MTPWTRWQQRGLARALEEKEKLEAEIKRSEEALAAARKVIEDWEKLNQARLLGSAFRTGLPSSKMAALFECFTCGDVFCNLAKHKERCKTGT